MWREVVLIVSGEVAETALEADLVRTEGATQVSARQYHLKMDGRDLEVAFGSLRSEYTQSEYEFVQGRVDDPRFVLVLYMETKALESFVSVVRDEWSPLFDIEGVGELQLMSAGRALEEVRKRSY